MTTGETVHVLITRPEGSHTKPMDFTRRQMNEYIYVDPEGTKSAPQVPMAHTRAEVCLGST